MASFSHLVSVLSPYENYWAATLSARYRGPFPLPANGAVQFVGIEPGVNVRDDDDLPVVVAVGINYDQGANPAAHLRWLKDVKGVPDGVTDCYWKLGIGSDMRDALDYALESYHSNSRHWASPLNGIIHSSGGIPKPENYVLIATNLSPFITEKKWTSCKPASALRTLRSMWCADHHLDALLDTLTKNRIMVDFWVGHGTDNVWIEFGNWQAKHSLLPSILTYNLSRQGLANMMGAHSDPNHCRHDLFK